MELELLAGVAEPRLKGDPIAEVRRQGDDDPPAAQRPPLAVDSHAAAGDLDLPRRSAEPHIAGDPLAQAQRERLRPLDKAPLLSAALDLDELEQPPRRAGVGEEVEHRDLARLDREERAQGQVEHRSDVAAADVPTLPGLEREPVELRRPR